MCTAVTCHIGSVFVAMQMCFSFTVSLIWLTSRLAPGWQREREHLCLDDTWQLLLTFTINLTWLLWLSLAGNCIRRLKAFSYWHLLEFALALAISYGFFCFKQIRREFSCYCFYLYSIALWIVVSADPPVAGVSLLIFPPFLWADRMQGHISSLPNQT